jgi:hypothetical protein
MVALVVSVAAALPTLAGCGGGSRAVGTTPSGVRPAGKVPANPVLGDPFLSVAKREVRLERLAAESSQRCFHSDEPVAEELACHKGLELARELARRVDEAIERLKGRGIDTSFVLRVFRQDAAAAWARSVETASAAGAALDAGSGRTRRKLASRFRDLSIEGRRLVAVIHSQAVELSRPVRPSSRGERPSTGLSRQTADELKQATEPDRGDRG